jgi:hypothetical protein
MFCRFVATVCLDILLLDINYTVDRDGWVILKLILKRGQKMWTVINWLRCLAIAGSYGLDNGTQGSTRGG